MAFFSPRLCLLLLLALLAVSCAHPPAFFAATPAVQVFAQAEAAVETRSVVCRVGEAVVLELDENRTTGFAWDVASLPPQLGEPAVTRMAAGASAATPDQTEKAVASPAPVGAPGSIRYEFPAAQAGQGVLVLAYRRAWEHDVFPIRLLVGLVDVR